MRKSLLCKVWRKFSRTTLDRFPKSFSESRRVFEEKAQVLLRASPHTNHQLDAISQAFIDVGIE